MCAASSAGSECSPVIAHAQPMNLHHSTELVCQRGLLGVIRLLRDRGVQRCQKAGQVEPGRRDAQDLARLRLAGLRSDQIQSERVGQSGADIGGGHWGGSSYARDSPG